MKDPMVIAPIVLAVPTLCVISFFIGLFIGTQNGYTDGANYGITYCNEKQDACKIEYSYLKLKQLQSSKK